MKKLLLTLSILIFLFNLKVQAQTNQMVTAGTTTTAVTFPGPGCTYNWVNDAPGIGLAASGTGDISSFTAVNNTNSVVTATITATPAPSGFAYIANTATGDVSVINIATNKVITTIPISAGLSGVAVSPDGTHVYVSASDLWEVAVINTSTNTVSTFIIVDQSPYGLCVSPDGSKLYVANYGSGTVTVINTLTNNIITKIPVGVGPMGVTLSRDGSRLYVANNYDNSITVINTLNNSVLSTITGVKTPICISVSPDGKTIYVTDGYNGVITDGYITVINTATNVVEKTITAAFTPFGIAITADGSMIYETNANSNSVSVINTSTNSIVATIQVQQQPQGISISPDGSEVYVANYRQNTVSVISTLSNTVTTTIQVGSAPNSIGNFITGNYNCTPVKFTITVNPANAAPPVITPSTATGTITACAGTASTSPNIQQFTVSGSNLQGDILASAPSVFEVSLSPNSGYGNFVTLKQTAGVVNSTIIYVRSATTASTGIKSGFIDLTSGGFAGTPVPVTETINALPTVNTVSQQKLNNGQLTNAINFTGTGDTFNWVNDTPGIGLAASGTGDISAFTAVNTGSNPVAATISATPLSVGYAYVPNYGSDNVSVINTTTNTEIKKISVGVNPWGVSVSPKGNFVYVTNQTSNSVSVIDATTNILFTTIGVGLSPEGITVSPDGSRVYVANETSGTVSVIDAATNKVISNITVGANPQGITVSPDGNHVYVTSATSNNISVISTATNIVTATVGVGTSPIAVAVSPDNSKIYVANFNSGSVSVINATANAILTTIPVGLSPEAITVSPDGKFVYVTNGGSSSVSVISTLTNGVISSIPIASTPEGVSVSQDGKLLYIASFGGASVSVFDISANSVIATIGVGQFPGIRGNFLKNGTGCTGVPTKFNITVSPDPAAVPTIVQPITTGTIVACLGVPSASPYIQQFTVNATNLTGSITATAAPVSQFEISLNANTGFGSSLTIPETGGVVNNVVVYIRSAASTTAGNLTGGVKLSSPGALSVNAEAKGVVNIPPSMDGNVPSPTYINGQQTAAINFSSNGNTVDWVNDTPGIGLPASGTGNIPAFTAVNAGTTAIVAHIIATPTSPGTGCTGTPASFTITVSPTSPPTIAVTGPLSPLNTIYGTPSTSTVFSVLGTGLTSGILVTPPAGFEVSTNDVAFASFVTLSSAGTQVYIRLAATTHVGPHSGEIRLTSAGAADAQLDMPQSTVTPAPLTITADNKSKTAGTANPVLTATYTGFVNGDTPADLTSQPVLSTIADISSPIGQYPITLSGYASTDYTITPVSGILTVIGAIVIPNTFTPNGDGINDTWNIKYLDAYTTCTVQIFTRYGENVYSSIGYGTPWDGTFKGSKLPTGTYYYVINLKNDSKLLAGYIAIVR